MVRFPDDYQNLGAELTLLSVVPLPKTGEKRTTRLKTLRWCLTNSLKIGTVLEPFALIGRDSLVQVGL